MPKHLDKRFGVTKRRIRSAANYTAAGSKKAYDFVTLGRQKIDAPTFTFFLLPNQT